MDKSLLFCGRKEKFDCSLFTSVYRRTFGTIVEKLNLFQWHEHSRDLNSKNVETINENLKNHPNIKKIKQHFKNTTLSLSLKHVTTYKVKKVTLDFKNDKAAGGEINRQISKNASAYLKV